MRHGSFRVVQLAQATQGFRLRSLCIRIKRKKWVGAPQPPTACPAPQCAHSQPASASGSQSPASASSQALHPLRPAGGEAGASPGQVSDLTALQTPLGWGCSCAPLPAQTQVRPHPPHRGHRPSTLGGIPQDTPGAPLPPVLLIRGQGKHVFLGQNSEIYRSKCLKDSREGKGE